MYFKRTIVVPGVSSRRGNELNIRVGEATTVKIRYGPHPNPTDKHVLTLTAQTVADPPTSCLAFLTGLATGATEASTEVYWERSLGPGRTLSSEPADIPEPVREFAEEISDGLWRAAVGTFEALRWRTGLPTPREPYREGPFNLSVDGAEWRRMPGSEVWRLMPDRMFLMTPEAQEAVQSLLNGGSTEPVAQALLREAVDVAESNRASAVVISVAAIEAGVKHLASDLIPDARWFLQEAQSPPLFRLLKDFLPTLPVRQGRAVALDPTTRKAVQKAAEERNRIVHRGTSTYDRDRTQHLLGCAGDLLYLFDFYAGHDWAWHRLSREFRQANSDARPTAGPDLMTGYI